MSAPRDPLDQLAWRDPLLLCQLSLQGGKQADCGMSGEHDRDFCASASNCEFEPVAAPSGRGRAFNKYLGESLHSSPSFACCSPTPYRTVVTESVAIEAELRGSEHKALSCKCFSNNRIRARSSLRAAKRARVSPPLPRARTFSRMTTTMQPRQSDHCQITLRSLEGPLGVIHRQAHGAPVSCDSDPAQSLRHVATPRGLVRTLHFIRPLVARREHGRAGASSQL
jgi:hypothetical protein